MIEKMALKWLKQALHDLELAEKNISIEGYDTSAFLSHQSVEKLLKAVFVIKGKKIPKTHYIDELAKGLGLTGKIIDAVSELTADYTFARYPDVSQQAPYEMYDEEIAKDKVKRAKEVFELLKDFYKTLLEKKND